MVFVESAGILGAFALLVIFFMVKTHKTLLQSIVVFLKNQVITIILALLAFLYFSYSQYTIKELIDVTILTAFIVSSILRVTYEVIIRTIQIHIEDKTKLTTNYNELVKKYKDTFYVLDEKEVTEIKNGELVKEKIKIPIIVDADWKEFKKIVVANDSTNMYEIPKEIEKYKYELLSAHSASNKYNHLNIRVDNWYKKENTNELVLSTSRTTYYSSLMTNRAMDYLLGDGITVRDVLQYGPFIPSLKESNLSNHLGINLFVITSDGYIPFVLRNKIVSIGKKTYGTSVGASVKAKSVLNDAGDRVRWSGIEKSIRQEIEDELSINKDDIDSIEIIAAYRDIVEGNKPQLLGIAYLKCDKENIPSNIRTKWYELRSIIKILFHDKKEAPKYIRNCITKESKALRDGNSFIWIKKDDFIDEMKVYENYFYTKKVIGKIKKKYPIVPSVAASISLTNKYLQMTSRKRILDFKNGKEKETKGKI